MLIRAHHFPLRIRIRALPAGHKAPDALARDDAELRARRWAREEGHRVPWLRCALALHYLAAKHDPVHGAAQQAVGPVREKVANVDEDGRAWVVFRARRVHGDGRPGEAVAGLHLQTGLPTEAEEQGEGAIVGVGAGAHVRCGVDGAGGGRVAKKAQDGVAFVAGLDLVRAGEEVADLGEGLG